MNEITPLVKWAGGKRQLLDELKMHMPKKYKTYYEPFVGGGALFFAIQPKNAVINDLNTELANLYRTVRTNNSYKKLLETLDKHEVQHSEEYYYNLRNIDRNKEEYNKMNRYEKSARALYINKACFNGLYRVNSKGEFNVPFNGKKTIKTYELSNLNSMHEYLSSNNIKICSKDYEKVVATAKKNDFVYFDPPYDVLEDKNSFTSYTKNDFDKKEQERLCKVFKKLDKKGVKVMLSNSNTEFIRNLYKDFNIHIVKARRNINSKGDNRGEVEEVIITNY